MDALFIYLAVVNIMTFIAYGLDKRRAVRESRRVPEKILHSLALLGGSPGAWVAQRVFRHKTRKISFQCVFWLIMVCQAGVICYLYMR